ncbi:MAG: lipoyl synthase [Candidatus Aenigmatarchaeota archaeon]
MSLPQWIGVKPYDKESYLKTKSLLDECGLNTVCIEADCPNRYECFSNGTATFIILGDTCTRNCLYCNIKKGIPKPVDKKEPERIASAVRKLNLKYVVVTCVTRDDLKDGGAGHFANTVKEIRKSNPNCRIELLVSDFKGNWNALKKVLDAKPYAINHNIEVARELFPKLRPKGSYEISLELLRKVKETNPGIITKSGFMVGVGETKSQIIQTLKDLKKAGCDIVTIGQYLQPENSVFPVKKYYTKNEFKSIEKKAKEIGFKKVLAGPLVRSSYMAEKRGGII